MSFDVDDINYYKQKSKDTKIYFNNFIENEYGFASWDINWEEQSLVLINVYGDGKYWDMFFTGLAKRLGLKKIVFGTKRSPKAFERKYKYKLVGYIMEKEV